MLVRVMYMIVVFSLTIFFYTLIRYNEKNLKFELYKNLLGLN